MVSPLLIILVIVIFCLGFFSGAMFGLSSERSRQAWQSYHRQRWVRELRNYSNQSPNSN